MPRKQRAAISGLRHRKLHYTDLAPRPLGRYDYPAKNVIRAHLVPFFLDGVPLRQREDLHAWFFPSHHRAEIDAYVRHGFSESQLRAFEWSKKVADRIAAIAPTLPLYRGALTDFLASPDHRREWCDWANLDFDGAALTFAGEIYGVVSRMRADVAPRLAFTSFLHRGRGVLAESIALALMTRTALPEAFTVGADLLRVSNERAGLQSQNGPSWFYIMREIALAMVVVRAFGGRSYGSGDERSAAQFRERFDATVEELQRTLGGAARRLLDRPGTFPEIVSSQLAPILERRRIPLRITGWQRFMHYTPKRRSRMLTWMLACTPVTRSDMSMYQWLEYLLTMAPLLHVFDDAGRLAGGHGDHLCRWCPQLEESYPPIGQPLDGAPAPLAVQDHVPAAQHDASRPSIRDVLPVPPQTMTATHRVTEGGEPIMTNEPEVSGTVVHDATREGPLSLTEVKSLLVGSIDALKAEIAGTTSGLAIVLDLAQRITNDLERLVAIENGVQQIREAEARLVSTIEIAAHTMVPSAPRVASTGGAAVAVRKPAKRSRRKRVTAKVLDDLRLELLRARAKGKEAYGVARDRILARYALGQKTIGPLLTVASHEKTAYMFAVRMLVRAPTTDREALAKELEELTRGKVRAQSALAGIPSSRMSSRGS